MLIKTKFGYFEKTMSKSSGNIYGGNYCQGRPHEFNEIIPVFTQDVNNAMDISKFGIANQIRVIVEYLQDLKEEIRMEIFENE